MKMPTPFECAPRLVDIGGGRRLGVEIKGQGPTVVLEASGPGYGVTGWGTFDQLLAEHATVVTYDRFGVGCSRPLLMEPSSERPPTPTEHAHHLAALLDQLPVRQPVILVGWSMGGLIAQQFAALHPRRVAALLLMDPSIFADQVPSDWQPGWLRWFSARFAPLHARRMAKKVRAGAYAAPSRQRKWRAQLETALGPGFAPELKETYLQAFLARADVHDSLADLLQQLPAACAETARTVRSNGFPDVPKSLLLSGYFGAKPGKMVLRMMNQMHEAYSRKARELGFELQVLPEVSHQIPLEAPALCVDAVRKLIGRVRPGP